VTRETIFIIRRVLRVTPRRATSERGSLAMIHKDGLDAFVTAAVTAATAIH